MREVSEPGVLSVDSFCYGQCSFQGIMGNVASTSDAVDDEVVQALQFFELLVCNVVHVGAVGYIPESESQNWEFKMFTADRDNLYSVNAERMLVDSVYIPFWSSRISVFSKGI